MKISLSFWEQILINESDFRAKPTLLLAFFCAASFEKRWTCLLGKVTEQLSWWLISEVLLESGHVPPCGGGGGEAPQITTQGQGQEERKTSLHP